MYENIEKNQFYNDSSPFSRYKYGVFNLFIQDLMLKCQLEGCTKPVYCVQEMSVSEQSVGIQLIYFSYCIYQNMVRYFWANSKDPY